MSFDAGENYVSFDANVRENCVQLHLGLLNLMHWSLKDYMSE